MDTERLTLWAGHFCQELSTSSELQSHLAEHQRRSQRAQAMLTVERIPTLTEADLREMFFDSDAFGFWSNKEWEFNDRVQSVGLDGLRRALLELVTRAERGLTPADLQQVWDMRGLGTLLATELLAYRFPSRYWTFSANVTLPALQALGDDVKASMPRGQKSNPYLYLALEPRMAQVCQSLVSAGIAEADNLLADIFLWWMNKKAPALTQPEPPEGTGIPDVNASKIEQAIQDFKSRPEWSNWESNRTHQYAILWQGQRYPVKEIIRMATGVTNFVSTQARVYLQKRGFQIVSLHPDSANVWLFQANPRIYDLETGLRHHRINDWQVNRYRGEIQNGDRVVFWKAGENRGIYGLGTMVSNLHQRQNGDWVVDVRYDGHLRQPVLYETLVEHPVLSNMLIMRQQQGTNFRIAPEEWAALQPLIGQVVRPTEMP